MGITVNAQDYTVAIPEGKLQEVKEICEKFQGREVKTRKELQSLLGKLLYISKTIKPARAFLNRMLGTLRSMTYCNYA